MSDLVSSNWDTESTNTKQKQDSIVFTTVKRWKLQQMEEETLGL